MEHLKLRKHSIVPLLSNISTAHFCSPWEPRENAFLWFKACSEKPSPRLLSQKTIFCFAALRKHSFYNSSSSSVRSRIRGERQEKKNNEHLALWMTARWGKDPGTQQSRMKSGKGNYNGENIELQEMRTWVEVLRGIRNIAGSMKSSVCYEWIQWKQKEASADPSPRSDIWF